MKGNCKWIQAVLLLVILIVTIWPNLIGATASFWVIIVAAILLLIHACTCKSCRTGMSDMSSKAVKTPSKGKK